MKIATEIWKDVVGWEQLYKVSNFGRVKSLRRRVYRGRMGWYVRRERYLKPCTGTSGHLVVGLHKDGITKLVGVHRLVLEAFVGLCPEGMEACHFPDRDPMNNRLQNLQWGNRETQYQHRVIHGTDRRTDRVMKVCLHCGKTFEHPRWFDRKCCSISCSNKEIAGTRKGYHKAGRWTCRCLTCDKEMVFKFHCHAKVRKFCSMACSGKYKGGVICV